MGMSIRAYSNIKFEHDLDIINTTLILDGVELDMDDYVEDFLKLKTYDPSFDLIQNGDLKEGYYSYENGLLVARYSCSGYNGYRDILAQKVGYQKEGYYDYFKNYKETHLYGAYLAEGGPFHELLKFYDEQGYFCTAVCHKLYNDFVKHQHFIKNETLDIFSFSDFYTDVMEGFKFAAENNGCVVLS